ncbi:MAG: alpha-hydroxy acid oxidase [Pseudomonadota bacterium]
MELDYRYPAISDLKSRARRRVPCYIWEYLDSANGTESAKTRAEAALDAVQLSPDILLGAVTAELSTEFLGHTYQAPFGIAPVGMSGAFWPDAEALLARTAVETQIPYCLSTVSATTPEDVAPHLGQQGWFQLYPSGDTKIRQDMLARVKAAGFHTLVLTVDVPALSWREREKRVQLKNPMALTPSIILQSALRPVWAFGQVQQPALRPRIFDKYADPSGTSGHDKHIGQTLRVVPDWEYLDILRREWDGSLIVKGVLDAAPVPRLIEAGADAIWVSNHGGRQFEAAPAPLDVLPAIRDAAGLDYPLICDGGVRSGTDVLRMMARGADFVMLGRAFHYGLAAAGAAGAAHVVRLLSQQMVLDMAQLGIARPSEAHTRLPA